ncbi:4'-phosphopantetheinyl transferase family protein [Chryseobacterium sp. A321]
MPFYQDFTTENAQILFWKYESTDTFDLPNLLGRETQQQVENYHPKKRLEYLMVRQMLKLNRPGHRILYKSIGQPYLDPKDAFVSITHSFPFAALAISQRRVGIDIEQIMPKIKRIEHKFLHDSEISWTRGEFQVEFLTVIWVIKEALYKLHPSKYWSLKKYYRVEPFSLEDLSKVRCEVFDTHFKDSYIARVQKIEDYYFAIIEEHHELNFPLKANALL